MFRESPLPDGTKGPLSMRRIGAFIFVLTSVSSGLISVLFQSDWKAICVAFGVPGVIALGLLICTTATDIKTIISAVKSAT